MNDNSFYYRLLSQVDGLGWRRLEVLLSYFGGIEQVWESTPSSWLSLGVDRRVVKNFAIAKSEGDKSVHAYQFVSYEDGEYPDKLRNISSPPIGLFYQGDVSLLSKKSVAVIGTRKMSAYGEKVARGMTRDLVERGLVIVSGLAFGVDRVAHETTLSSGGYTVGVLSHGIDYEYHREHKALVDKIPENKGLIVSEHPPLAKSSPQRLAVRNRIVSGLSDAVLVVEAPRKSGTKITVGFAAEQGKDVYVVPGPIDLESYHGSHEIIRDGGIPISTSSDIEV